MANGKSQESVSEAANAYYGAALTGHVVATRLRTAAAARPAAVAEGGKGGEGGGAVDDPAVWEEVCA
jgi:hypothetical protein